MNKNMKRVWIGFICFMLTGFGIAFKSEHDYNITHAKEIKQRAGEIAKQAHLDELNKLGNDVCQNHDYGDTENNQVIYDVDNIQELNNDKYSVDCDWTAGRVVEGTQKRIILKEGTVHLTFEAR